MGDGGKPGDGSGSSPLPDDLDTDSIYDDLMLKVARAPSVDPERLKELAPRAGPSLVGQTLAHFKVVERLGAGGMGVVYRAEDEKLRRTVALKVLSGQLQDGRRNQWLLGEARSAAAVSHPNIAAIYEVGEAQGLAFIAMEYVEGKSLRALVGERALPVGRALPLAVQIARGMGRAHQGGIVHRDLKPDNVMVGPDGLVKLLDFGLAMPVSKLEEGGQPQWSTGRAGTVAYMSPEQARGEAVDARSDVYSFGVMLFEMLAGRRPVGGAVREEALALVPVGAAAAQVEALRRVLGRCLAPRPEERYPDGAALVEALQELSAGGPPPRGPRRVWPGLVAVVLVLAGAGGYIAVNPELRPERGPVEVHERKLTANPRENLLVDAALSPDGKVLAYTDQSGLFLRGVDPERTDALSLPNQQQPQLVAWFPKGDELLVASALEGGLKELWRLRVTGEARSLGVGRYAGIRVAPDGTTFAWKAPDGIRVGPVEDPSRSRLAVPEQEGEWLQQPCWSPDGKWLGYLRISQSMAALETLSLETGARQVLKETPLLVNELGDGALAWAPNGELVFALSDLPPKEEGFTLWRLAVDLESGKARGSARPIHGWSGFYPDLLSVAANGSLALARFTAQSDVYVGELSDGGRQMSPPLRLTLSERDDVPADWSPDGQTLLFTSDRDGTTDMFMQRLDGSEPAKVEVGRDFKTWPMFARSGNELLFWRYPWPPNERPQPAELVRMSLPSGQPTHVLTTRTVSNWTWRQGAPWKAHFHCAARAELCVLGELEGHELVFSSMDPRSGRGRELGRIEALTSDPHAWSLSPDGQRIALPGQLGELRILELSSGERTLHRVDPECRLLHVAWGSSGRDLFATGNCKRDQVLTRVFHIELDGPTQVLWEKTSAWISRPVASADGRHLAISVHLLGNEMWLISGF